MSRTEIKLLAKAEFKDHWGVLLLVLALGWIAGWFGVLLGFGIGGFIVLGPLYVGIYYVYLNAIQKKDTDWKDMFFGFRKMFADSFLTGVLIMAIMFVASAILSFVGIILGSIIRKIIFSISSSSHSYDDYDTVLNEMHYYGSSFASTALSAVITFIIVSTAVEIVLIIIALKYAEAPILLLKEPGIRPIDALKKSRIMMRGNALELFIFDLTYIGWFILVALTFGILIIYVGPYYLYARTMMLNQFYEKKRNVSMDDDEELQKLNAMKASVKNRTEAVTDKIKEKKTEHDAVKETPIESEPVESKEHIALNVCKFCGAELPEGASFCGKCGKRQ